MPKADLIDKRIRRKLSGLKMALRSRLLGEGLSWLLLVLVAVVFITLAFDYILRMDRLQRAMLMVLALAWAVWVAWRRLLAPMLAPMGVEALALLVESRYSQLGDRLISAVQFSRRRREDATASEVMIARVADQANELAGLLEFTPIVERRCLWRVLAASLCAAAVLGGFWSWQSDVMALWFARNVTFADVPWPQKTYLGVRGGPDFTVLRGESLEVTVEADESSVAPPQVVVHARYPSVGMTEVQVDPGGNGSRTYVWASPPVGEPFEFYVTGGDDQRDKRRPHAVHVIDPPALRAVQFTVHYPSYMKREARSFDASSGVLNVPVGGYVSISAVASKDLRLARIFLDDQELQPPMQIRPLGAEAAEPVPSSPAAGNAASTQSGGGPASSPAAPATRVAAPKGPPRGLVGGFAIEAAKGAATRPVKRDPARTLRLALTDTAGFTNPRAGQYVIQVLPDQAPSVSLKKKGVGATVTPQAIIPLFLEIKDDCGVAEVKVVHAIIGAKESLPPALIKDLGSDPRNIRTRHDLDLAGSKLQPGQSIQVFVTALDTLPESLNGPDKTSSGTLDFRIVKDEDLMAELVRRQKELRLEFEQSVAMQASAQAKTLAAIEASRAAVSPEARRCLSESSSLESSVSTECVKAAAILEEILEEMVNNRLGTPADHGQLSDGIIKPLKQLAGPTSQVVAALQGAGKLDDAAALRDQAEKIAAVQKDILAQLRAILDRMQKLESRQELAYKLEMIIKWWDEVLKTTEKHGEAEVGNIFEPATKPAKEQK